MESFSLRESLEALPASAPVENLTAAELMALLAGLPTDGPAEAAPGIPPLEFTGDAEDAMAQLVGYTGIPISDELADIVPVAGDIAMGLKLVLEAAHLERNSKHIRIDDRRRIHAVKALALLSKFGVGTVCGMLGGALGTVILPGAGSLAGGLGGIGLSVYVNYALKSRIMELALVFTNLTMDDLFYFKNKKAIDALGASFAATGV